MRCVCAYDDNECVVILGLFVYNSSRARHNMSPLSVMPHVLSQLTYAVSLRKVCAKGSHVVICGLQLAINSVIFVHDTILVSRIIFAEFARSGYMMLFLDCGR